MELEVQQIVRICDRHFGVGSDGILVVGKSKLAGVDYDYRMYNPDGSEAEMCGNGIRCYMKYLRDNKLTTKKRIKVQTGKGVLTIEMMDSGMICVDMGTPILDPMSIGFIGEQNIVKAHERLFTFTPVSMGNPHAVVYLKRGELEDFDIARYGSAIENMREMFKNRTNVEFLEILSETEINMRVWERGAGETLACGTGACGAVVA
ncbi:MAG: diaminopimelate epimerase [Candidatus Peribacteria bacterium]|nr:MAG: diaminopimelate epimerase [Candidatus Peribacteria bacterium]